MSCQRVDIVRWTAVGIKTVLAVAVRIDGTGEWCAYIGTVPGVDHVSESLEVSMYGGKLLEPIARAIFPRMEGEYCP